MSKLYKTLLSIVVLATVLVTVNMVVMAGNDHICLYSNCSNKSYGELYCTKHRCANGSCTSKIISGSRYCASHTCKEIGCFEKVNSANERCKKHKEQYNTKSDKKTTSSSGYGCTKVKTNTSKNTKNNTTDSKKNDSFEAYKYDHPEDFYDEYYDDFFDEYDAEDYWDEYH